MKNALWIVFAFVLLFTSCSKSSGPGKNSSTDTTANNTSPTIGAAVYLVGAYSTGAALGHAAYWKNDSVTVLNGGTISSCTSMAFSDTDVYIAGETDAQAVYWKNGKMVSLSHGFSSEGAVGIGLIGQDVYVAGTGINNVNGEATFGYWKNGLYTQLSADSNFAYCTGMTIAGGNLYVVGWEQNPSTNFIVAKIWVNGIETNLTNDTGRAAANGVYVSGNDVYVVGAEMDAAKTHYIAKYWKNGNPVVLQDSVGANIFATSITMSGSDIYITGTKTPTTGGNSIVGYWKNASFVQIAGIAAAYHIGNLGILGSDIYIPYYITGSNSFYEGGFLKDGQPTILFDGVHTLGQVTGVFIH
jgi:hypothetical protein